jgi:rubrerythrin
MSLKGSKTAQNLLKAFGIETQAHRRYMYFALQAEQEGLPDIAMLFRSTAEGEVGHANGHLELLQSVGDPLTGLPFGSTADNLRAAIASEAMETTDIYPAFARMAREEGFHDIADWFETLAKAENSHSHRYQKALDQFAKT